MEVIGGTGEMQKESVFLRSFPLQHEWIQLLCFLKDQIEFDSAFQVCWKLGFYSRANRPSYIQVTKGGSRRGEIGKEKIVKRAKGRS